MNQVNVSVNLVDQPVPHREITYSSGPTDKSLMKELLMKVWAGFKDMMKPTTGTHQHLVGTNRGKRETEQVMVRTAMSWKRDP